MKVSDYVAQFLADKGIGHVFAVSGGASLHLIHSVARTPGIDFICPQHEQAGAMAADGYARATGRIAAAIATSGPGATNLLTGVCCSYYDSVPMLLITGQVATFRMAGDTGVRQIGFQETPAIEIFRPVTKHVTQVLEPADILYELEKAYHIATSGRPGPVLIDIPDDLQRVELDACDLRKYTPSDGEQAEEAAGLPVVDELRKLLEQASRPVVVLGWGIRLAKAESEVSDFLRSCQIPVAPTWAMADFLAHDDPLLIGTFGTHGTRHANFAVQNADLIVSLGARLDSKATGTPPASFARAAKKVVIDIDAAELAKFDQVGVGIDLSIRADVREFLAAFNRTARAREATNFDSWIRRVQDWKTRYPVCPSSYHEEKTLNPYVFVKQLSALLSEGDRIVVDTGCAIAWMMQAFEFKRDQRLLHDFNNTAMGWALPASVGVALADPTRRIVCVVGDGSLQMNIQELATIIRHELPIKIFLINNGGYSMIQQTQEQWFDGKYLASTVAGGLAFPDFRAVARAYGYPTSEIALNADCASTIRDVLVAEGAHFCDVRISPHHRVIPQVKAGRPNEDPDPLLPRDAFLANMIIDPLDISTGDISSAAGS